MKKLRMLFLLGGTLLLSVAPLAAQNSVVVLGRGPQPSNTTGCSFLPNCILASFDGSSNRVRRSLLFPPPRRAQSAWPIAVCSPGCSPRRSPTARQGVLL